MSTRTSRSKPCTPRASRRSPAECLATQRKGRMHASTLTLSLRGGPDSRADRVLLRILPAHLPRSWTAWAVFPASHTSTPNASTRTRRTQAQERAASRERPPGELDGYPESRSGARMMIHRTPSLCRPNARLGSTGPRLVFLPRRVQARWWRESRGRVQAHADELPSRVLALRIHDDL
ncbi:hypothetical protein MSAN_02489000 [Mycena sanguinolenta]|uniref:Uncharacterized protein n=1 Tax=Mycena sanguinolenta TaxID=230812 RepID=A0A8H6WUD5_9AGAR|nr:hypothetical protein MSAN_02489000 [Mycena sanguinolenta]